MDAEPITRSLLLAQLPAGSCAFCFIHIADSHFLALYDTIFVNDSGDLGQTPCHSLVFGNDGGESIFVDMEMKSLFRDNSKSYLLLAILGILAGFAVVLFCELPDNRLWDFYYWSSNTFGFWMFSTSLIALFSEKRKCAAINAGIYIFLMFLITTIYKSFRLYWVGNTPFLSLLDLSVNSVYGWLIYSIPAALLCAALGFVLWSGRKNTFWGKTLRVLPALFILIETVVLLYSVFAYQTKLFSALTNLICLVVYIVEIKKTTITQSG